MNWLPATTIRVIITGSVPKSHNNKNRAGGEATRLLRIFCCYAFPAHLIPSHPILSVSPSIHEFRKLLYLVKLMESLKTSTFLLILEISEISNIKIGKKIGMSGSV